VTRFLPRLHLRYGRIENAAHHCYAGFFPQPRWRVVLDGPHLFHPSENEKVPQIPKSIPSHCLFHCLVLLHNMFTHSRNLASIVVWCHHVSHFLSYHNPFTRKIILSCLSTVQSRTSRVLLGILEGFSPYCSSGGACDAVRTGYPHFSGRARLLTWTLEIWKKDLSDAWKLVPKDKWKNSKPARAVFKRLLVQPGRRLTRSTIEDDIWSDGVYLFNEKKRVERK
jgi:hypothetical protein